MSRFRQNSNLSGASPDDFEGEAKFQDLVAQAETVHTGLGFQKLQEKDPNFSQTILLDFLSFLYAQVQTKSGLNQLDEMGAYLAEEVILSLQTANRERNPGRRILGIKGIVLGALQIIDLKELESKFQLRVHFEANYLETFKVGSNEESQSWYATEDWVLVRDKKCISKKLGEAESLNCRACGAPPVVSSAGRCPNCNAMLRFGQQDWFVESIERTLTEKPPLILADVEETGTDLPTIQDPNLELGLDLIFGSDSKAVLPEVLDRFLRIFELAQIAWSKRDLSIIRPFESDGIFQTHQYWIEMYLKMKLINRLEDLEVRDILLVKANKDLFFESVTVRIFAAVKDYTVYENGKVAVGSPHVPREFSEYWTFIRSVNYQSKKAGASLHQCPSCGAELKINWVGACEFCGTKITKGEFDWVLSQISQDEAYFG